MSANQWSEAVRAGLESMDSYGVQLVNQADFLPTSSQSPDNSPQPSPDSQQKDLGASVSAQPQRQSHSLHSVKVADGQQARTLCSQQDQQVSQSSDLARSQSPVFHGGSRATISSSKDGKTLKPNQSGPVFSSGGASAGLTPHNVSKRQLPPHQQQLEGPGRNVGPAQQHVNPCHLPQPRQVSPQRPMSKMNSQISPSKQKSMQVSVQPNVNVGTSSSVPQSCPSGPVVVNFPRVPQQQSLGQQNLSQPVPQQSHRMPVGQRQPSPGTNVSPRNPQPMGLPVRIGAPRLSHPKQQSQQQLRPLLMRGPDGHLNRPPLSRPAPKQTPNFSHRNTNSNPLVTPSAKGNFQRSHPEGIHSSDGDGHPMGHMSEDYMYNEDYDGPMEGVYDPGYEDDEDYDEDMEEEQYDYDGPPYDYDSEDASDDLSEEESTLFEELSHLSPNDPRYAEIVNRLREKGIERDEIEEMINPQMPEYHQVYGNEPYDEHDEEEDQEMDNNESAVSSSLQNQLSISQTRTRPQQTNIPQSHALLQGSQTQNQTPFSSSSQGTRAPSSKTSQSQPSHSQPVQAQSHQLNQPHGTQSQQQQQSLSQSSSIGPAQRASIIQHPAQRPSLRPHLPSPPHVAQQLNMQQQQRPKSLTNINQHRKVFQSPSQACSSTSHSEASDWPQHGQQPPAPEKSSPKGTATQQTQQMNPPRLQGPNRPPAANQLAQSHQGISFDRTPIQNINPRAQGPQAQIIQQGGTVQPPMVRGVSPRARVVQPGAPFGGPRLIAPQSHLRHRAVAPHHLRANVPQGQLRPPQVVSGATQSRLDVQHMQEMLDKQIRAKKGVAAVIPTQSRTVVSSSLGSEEQSYSPAQCLQQSAHVFQRPFLPPRRPISAAPPTLRRPNAPPRRAETPQVAQPVISRFNLPVRPRAPQPPQPSPQAKMGLQGATTGTATTINRNLVPQQGPISPINDASKTIQEQQKINPSGPQTSVSRPPSSSINLDTLTEAKLNLLSSRSGKLEPNKTYQIKSPLDQSIIYAVWNGEKFVLPGQDNAKGQTQPSPNAGTPSQQQEKSQNSSSSIPKPKAGGPPLGSSAFQDKFLQSLQASSTGHQENEPDTNTDSAEVHPAKPEAPQAPQSTSQTTYIKPLPKEPVEQRESDDEEEDEDDDSIFKKPFSENEDVFRVCNNCGYTSKNFKRCDGCKKLFQGEMKIHCTKKTSAKPVTPSPQPSSSGVSVKKQEMKPSDRFREVMSKVNFFGNKDSPRGGHGRGQASPRRGLGRTRGGGWKGKAGQQTEEEEQDYHSSDEESDGKRGMKRKSLRSKTATSAPKKRTKKTDEPVTVTISSDEDEPSSTSNLYPGFAPSPAGSAGSESPIFTTTHMNPVNAFGRFRRVRMEDEEGHSKLQKKIQTSQNTQSLMEQPEEGLEEDDEEEGDEPAVYEIDIRSVRIGSMRTQPLQPMFISLHGVCFKCRSERTDEEFEGEILCHEVEHVKFFAGQPQPVLFLFLSQECGEKLRNICHMEPGDEEYFDPCCTDMKQKMVVIIIESSNEMPLEMLRENLTLWADMNHQEDSDYLEELSEEMANDLLIQSAPPVLTADVERGVLKFKKRYIYEGEDPHIQPYPRLPASPNDGMDNEEPDSTSSSPPDIRNHFFGPPMRLLLYPPPPARGISITTEDLMCLAEGEFLNDVVIDFYLQYLYQERLSEANQKRTHIFSSFFYKRLTQRDRHSDKTEEDAKKSLPERRHARVKKWTKHVDLFSKDFIIVPINEHSHWYLAVICFPGLAKPEIVPYIPSAAHKSDPDETSNDGGGSESGTNSKDEGNNSQELKHTVLGRQLSGDECNNTDDGKLVGQKQPCILMFDSLAGPSRNPNVKMLKEYLQCEWNAKKQEDRQIAKIVRGSTPKVPQQSNFSDCGVFLLQYVESFFEDPIADFQIPMKGLQNWFPEELVLHKRRDIHELIMNLHQIYMEERGDPRILDIPFESTPRRQPPPPPMDIPNTNNQEHFLGKLEDVSGPGGALSRDDENSNSSAAWELAKPVPSPPFPVALRQNTMFEREESNASPIFPKADLQNDEDREEEGKEMDAEEEGEEEEEEEEGEVALVGFNHDSQNDLELEDSENVNNTEEKDCNAETEPTGEKAGKSEDTNSLEENPENREPVAEKSANESQVSG